MWQRVSNELSFSEIGRLLQIAPSTAHRIFMNFMETGEVDAKKKTGPRRHTRKLNDSLELFIIGVILETPSLYLHELCIKVEQMCGIEVCASTILTILHQHGFTRKKIRQVALQRSLSLRGIFIANALLYAMEMFVFLDETGCDNKSFMRKYGYAISGETPVCHRLLVRGKRYSAIAAIATDGLVAISEPTSSTIDSESFFDFIRGSLIPQMNSFDGSSPKSIVIMDNCTIHHVPEVKSMFDDVGIPVLFLPPYSPDYNPIEEAFSYVKSYLRKHDDLLQAIGDPRSVIQSAFHSITANQCMQWIKHSGYS